MTCFSRNYFGHVQIVWTWFKVWNSLVKSWFFGLVQNIFDLAKQIWTGPKQFRHVQNIFLPIKGQGKSPAMDIIKKNLRFVLVWAVLRSWIFKTKTRIKWRLDVWIIRFVSKSVCLIRRLLICNLHWKIDKVWIL